MQKSRFLDFTQLALIVHKSNFTPNTCELVAAKLAATLALQYPAFNRVTFMTVATTGVVPARNKRAKVLNLSPSPFLTLVA